MHGAILMTALALGAPALKEPPKKDGGIVGEWVVERLTIAAEDEPQPADCDRIMFDSAGKYFRRQGSTGELRKIGTYSVDVTAKPMTIDMEAHTPGGGKWQGIFKIEDDTLTLCLPPLERPARPTTFESPKDSFNQLYVYKRVKK